MNLCPVKRVGDSVRDDFVVAVLICWLFPTEVIASSPAPEWEEPLAWEILLQRCKEVIEVVRTPVREDEQANGVGR